MQNINKWTFTCAYFHFIFNMLHLVAFLLQMSLLFFQSGAIHLQFVVFICDLVVGLVLNMLFFFPRLIRSSSCILHFKLIMSCSLVFIIAPVVDYVIVSRYFFLILTLFCGSSFLFISCYRCGAYFLARIIFINQSLRSFFFF